MDTPQTEHITPQEAAKRLKRHVGYVYKLLESGRVPGAVITSSRRWMIPVALGEAPRVTKLTRGRPRRKTHPYTLVSPALKTQKKKPRR